LRTNIDVFLGNTFLGDNRCYSTPQSRQEYEISRLTELGDKGANVPSILKIDDGYFVMEKIPGETLAEKVIDGDEEVVSNIFQELQNLHKETGVYHGSPHPRNIIINGKKISWVDWETQLKKRSLTENQERDMRILYKDLAKKTTDADFLFDTMQAAYPKALNLVYQTR